MNERSIFLAALDIADPAQRAAYLDQSCGNDAALRQHIEELIAAEPKLGGFLAEPHGDVAVTSDLTPAPERPGTLIGPYKLLQIIGEGGMGVVYMADQEQPVRRRVALKIIKPGMDSRQVIARFEAERQALAMMDHQNIARVLDAGTTQSGRPYFVMELVHGVPLTKFCDDSRLTPRERLELFIPVCQAIQHAHQKGVIHRDIKPSNILVTMYDDKPVPKVIDFGVAKAVEQRLTDKTLFTQFGSLVGTFEYMSPEQAEMNAYGVDTRSDIYSLGVLLYELLTGTTPLERPRVRTAALVELVRLIKEEEPPRPSIRLSSTSTLPKFAAACRTEPARLSQLLRGELDWIVMKCLEKDRTRRYETASNLARDVQRYLKDEPVEACPPSAIYRMRKFGRRHRVALTSGALVTAALLIGLVVSIVFAVIAGQQRDQAELASRDAEAARHAETSERQVAIRERDEARRQREQVAALNATLEQETELQRRMLYTSDMNLVSAAWEADNVSRVLELLNAHRPQPGQRDLRGFEWHYWNRLCHSDLRTVKFSGNQGSLPAVFSPDCTRLAVVRYGDGGSLTRTLRVWDVEKGTELQAIRLLDGGPAPGVVSLAWHPDGNHVVVAIDDQRSGSVQLQMLDVAAQRPLFTINEPNIVEQLREALTSKSKLWFSGDGARVAVVVGRRDGDNPAQPIVKFWDSRTGEELAAIPLPGERVFSVTINADGSRIAFASRRDANENDTLGMTIKVLDVATPEKPVTIPCAGLASFRFSPNGQRLYVSGAANRSAGDVPRSEGGVFDTTTGEKLLSLPDTDPWWLANFSPDGNWLAVISKSRPRMVKLYRTAGEGRSLRLQGHTRDLIALEFSANSTRLYTAAGDQCLKTWDVSALQPETPRTESATVFTRLLTDVTSDGQKIASAPTSTRHAFGSPLPTDTRKNQISVRDHAGNVLFQTSELGGPIQRLRFSVDGRRLSACAVATAGDLTSAAQLSVWDAATGKEQLTLRLSAREETVIVEGKRDVRRMGPAVAFTPDGRRIAAMINLGSTPPRTSVLRIWDIDAQRQIGESAPVPDLLTELHVNPDGQQFVGVSDTSSRKLTVWNTRDGSLLWKVRTNGGVHGLGFSLNGKQMFGLVGSLGEIKMWDAQSGRERFTIRDPESVRASKFTLSPNGRWLAAGNRIVDSSATVKVWDVTRPERELYSLAGHGTAVQAIAFSHDSRRIATCARPANLLSGTGGETKIWDAESGQELLSLPGAARTIRFNADGTMLIAEAGDPVIGDIRVRRWDASPLPSHVDAEHIVAALAASRGQQALPLISEMLARIEADQALPDETRSAAIALVKGLRREKELRDAAWAIAATPNQPREAFERALQYMEEALAIDPTNRPAWTTRALVHYRLGQSDETLAALARGKQLRAAEKLAPPAEDLTILAMTQHDAGQHDEARATLEQVRASFSLHEVEWQTLMAEAEQRMGVPKAADNPRQWVGRKVMPRRAARPVNEVGDPVHPDMPWVISYVEGDRLWFGANSIPRSQVVVLEDAIAYYTATLQVEEENVGGYQRRGWAWRALGEYDRAIEDYTAALRLNPESDPLLSERGRTYKDDKHDLERALVDYDVLVRLNPSIASNHAARGNILREQGKLDDALASLDEAIRLAPHIGVFYSWRAYLWSAKGEHDKMSQDFDEGIRRSPENADCWTLRAWVLATAPNAEHRDGKQAIADATKACELTDWKNNSCLENLAAAYAETADFAQAVQWQEKAVFLTPAHKRSEYESRLKLYREGKPYRDVPRSSP